MAARSNDEIALVATPDKCVQKLDDCNEQISKLTGRVSKRYQHNTVLT